ncbi:glycosyltransferase [Humisphaera borealis]|uniref:Glycosyltransferase n=1 Tax=Humisphaera borealis TaxID=2807512 RepID=A0A7M2WXP1_9BACT|nr:glycosyltransferase [Humisphaera borealis]QOV90179.1 glycosyltransferase [Humisphaera borealis]
MLGANAIRLYHLPPEWLLDLACDAHLRVMVDVPWDKHRCFLEDWSAQSEAVEKIRTASVTIARHPAVFAVSVANEIPRDVVRYSGHQRVASFLDTLLDTLKQGAPDCLATYTNYPSTEFLSPSNLDFYCANVYLDDDEVLGRYLDRLHHVAAHLPLVLGEIGFDSLRKGPAHQSDALARHVRRVYRHGLAGAFVFSFTDDWYTGGHQIEDWAFGVTDVARQDKPAALAIRSIWAEAPRIDERGLPKVSVVVCSYNGATTLDECLRSLLRLNYPDYEVILIDDGSTDDTLEIAARYPQVRTIHQENRGLSAARNEGARLAVGEIVAYTDSDCVADSEWLLHLVLAMREQGVDAIGGPNVPPPSDNWVAKCVAASPGGPSHVMLDDRNAEHVPGCNMAFLRERLLSLGGFDVRFRQAGDDVDICWRYLDAGLTIGYAASALVWHHRRARAMDFYRQQKGYGRAEAMLQFKHPGRYKLLGGLRWAGVIYGVGAIALPVYQPAVYHGRFGNGPFQLIYRRNDYSVWAYVTLFEWHAVALLLATLGLILWGTELGHGLLTGATVFWLASAVAVLRSTATAPLPAAARWWCRPLVALFHVGQPIVRAWHRTAFRLRHKRLQACALNYSSTKSAARRVSRYAFDICWESRNGIGRERLLDELVERARADAWNGNWDLEWSPHDIELLGNLWWDARITSATEDLGGGRRFTRIRGTLQGTVFGRVVTVILTLISTAAILANLKAGLITIAIVAPIVVGARVWAGSRVRRAVTGLICRAGVAAGLSLVPSGVADQVINHPTGPIIREGVVT